ncbi:hypothetical protein BDZ94DRAFT_1309791 [Collybia nuda]|uniref:Uncharacterized protein n=1 Tax=Collybia nuda TaxID=64659 RepID=A0A9P6CIX5_9AGAR|nr:hypothetical protein BDZ94DRAFT_1309791 [Collybia nuda]
MVRLSCSRYGFVESIQTVLLTSTAEIFIAIRVYAITRKNLVFPCIAGLILASQWAIVLFATTLSTPDYPALLLSRDFPPLPTLPEIDPFHVCIFISTLTAVPFVKAFISLTLAFDGMAFLIILLVNFRSSSSYNMPMMKVIQRDGTVYFLVIFSSNLVWLVLLLHARLALKFIQNQPAMMYVQTLTLGETVIPTQHPSTPEFQLS